VRAGPPGFGLGFGLLIATGLGAPNANVAIVFNGLAFGIGASRRFETATPLG